LVDIIPKDAVSLDDFGTAKNVSTPNDMAGE